MALYICCPLKKLNEFGLEEKHARFLPDLTILYPRGTIPEGEKQFLRRMLEKYKGIFSMWDHFSVIFSAAVIIMVTCSFLLFSFSKCGLILMHGIKVLFSPY